MTRQSRTQQQHCETSTACCIDVQVDKHATNLEAMAAKTSLLAWIIQFHHLGFSFTSFPASANSIIVYRVCSDRAHLICMLIVINPLPPEPPHFLAGIFLLP
mmetsp:Transcript_46719/g.75148  ORF Transcript_46719/g.75148 Transcript_46719/m.75148 type:complete len:102 (-) Transcript_46719:960-1265(-)